MNILLLWHLRSRHIVCNVYIQGICAFDVSVFFASQEIIIISRRALAREGDYEMMSVCACVRALVSHADFSKTTTATDFL